MSEWTILHNPRCSKSRAALDLLVGRGIKPEVVEYLKTPLDVPCLQQLLSDLGIEVQSLLRSKEPVWTESGLSISDSDAVIQAIARYPVLMERPVIRCGRRAVIGRPTSNINNLF